MSKITVIGTGSVGSTIAYALTCLGLASEIVMIDINGEKSMGEADEKLAKAGAMFLAKQMEI